MIRSAKHMELISTPVATPGAGSPGEGQFTVEADRQRLGPVMFSSLQRKLRFLLQSQDLVGYRVLLNHQPLFLRGFDIKGVHDFVPGFEEDPSLDAPANLVAKFLYQNGFSKVDETDKVGCVCCCCQFEVGNWNHFDLEPLWTDWLCTSDVKLWF